MLEDQTMLLAVFERAALMTLLLLAYVAVVADRR